jgi:hypothetical protein
MYRALGLLKKDSDFDLDKAAARVVAKVPGSSSLRSGDTVTVAKGDWSIYLALVSGPHVKFESEGIVGKLAGLDADEAAELTESEQRVEVWTDDPDPFMEHFNDYLFVIEALKSFKGLTAVDPNEPAIL